MFNSISSEEMFKTTLRHELLTKDQETELLKRAKMGDAAAIDAIVKHNQKLVYSIASRYFRSGMCGDMQLMDLIQEGQFGIFEAIKHWNPSYNGKFSTYAVYWIKSVCRRRGLICGFPISVSFSFSEKAASVYRHWSKLSPRQNHEPTIEEISVSSGLPVSTIQDVVNATRKMVRLDDDENDDEEDGRPMAEMFMTRSELSPEEKTHNRIVFESLANALGELPEQWQKVIYYRYAFGTESAGLTYKQIGDLMHLSRTRIQQIEGLALKRMRESLEKEGITSLILEDDGC